MNTVPTTSTNAQTANAVGIRSSELVWRQRAPRLDKDGVPERAENWTLEDWRDLWNGIKRIKAKIAARHRVPGGITLSG